MNEREIQPRNSISENASPVPLIGPIQHAYQVVVIRIASGDLTARLTGDYRGDDACLERHINTTAVRLHDNRLNFAERANALLTASNEMNRVSQQMTARAGQIASQANSVSAASERISKIALLVAASGEQMHSSMREIAKNFGEAAHRHDRYGTG